MMTILKQVQIGIEFEDCLIWKDCTSGHYSPRSFCVIFHCDNESPLHEWEDIWVGLMPPKVETFCWQLLGLITHNTVLGGSGNMLSICITFWREFLVAFLLMCSEDATGYTDGLAKQGVNRRTNLLWVRE